ncbi:hypothetical protein HBB16_02640 [Pseudonocardia sp. MCCB 268]|nr:hypothetical protein [Pseudonocardia cytotoxica]
MARPDRVHLAGRTSGPLFSTRTGRRVDEPAAQPHPGAWPTAPATPGRPDQPAQPASHSSSPPRWMPGWCW